MSFFPISRWERDDNEFILHTIQYYHDAVSYSWDILKGMLWISWGKQKVFEMRIAIWQLWGKYQRKKFLLRWKTIAVLRNENDDGFEIKGKDKDLMTMVLNLHLSRPPGRRQGRRRWRTHDNACEPRSCKLGKDISIYCKKFTCK